MGENWDHEKRCRNWIPAGVVEDRLNLWDGETIPDNRVDLTDLVATNVIDESTRRDLQRGTGPDAQKALKNFAIHLVAADQIALQTAEKRPETITLTLTRDEAYEIAESEGFGHIATTKYLNPKRLWAGISYEASNE